MLLATAALPLPLHHPDHHGPKRHRHHHAHPATAPHDRRHGRKGQVDLAGLIATTAGRGAATAHGATAPRARTAGDPADTISDFKFAPATITVHVGDTITWSNAGPSPHSATANDRSFDTGVLKKGQSASHTFTQAGTFTYFCSVHPFMHGTVVVVADTSSSSPGSASGSGTGSSNSGSSTGSSGVGGGAGAGVAGSASGTTAAPPTATSSPGTLPLTGMDSGGAALIGLALAGGGVAIRRRIRTGR